MRYVKSRLAGNKYWRVAGSFIFSISAEGGIINALDSAPGPNQDAIRLTDRFFLGEPQIRGFDIRGIGPRVLRKFYDGDGNLSTDRQQWGDDALGGRYYYMSRAELEIPLGAGAREMGLRPSIYVDTGAVWGIRAPALSSIPAAGTTIPYLDSAGNQQCLGSDSTTLTPRPAEGCPSGSTLYGRTIAGFQEFFVGNTPKPRVSVGFGVNWNSPFGPFRIDIAKALVTVDGDDPKLFTFNVGTQF